MKVKLECGHIVDAVLTRHYNEFGSHIENYGCLECSAEKHRPNWHMEFAEYLLKYPHILRQYLGRATPVKNKARVSKN